MDLSKYVDLEVSRRFYQQFFKWHELQRKGYSIIQCMEVYSKSSFITLRGLAESLVINNNSLIWFKGDINE